MGQSKTSDPLFSFRAKVQRAKEHVNALAAEISAFEGDGSYFSIVKEVDIDSGAFRFRIRFNSSPDPRRWALLIGDCIHNLRSALDHLFWALVLQKHPLGDIKRDPTCTFPILSPDAFNGRKKKLEAWVGHEATALLERCQPFRFPKQDTPLFLINAYDVTDKHKLLVPLMQTINIAAAAMTGMPGTKCNPEFPLGPLEDGAVVARFTFVPPHTEMDVDFRPTLQIVLRNENGYPVPVLVGLRSFILGVEKVGEAFAQFFH